MRFLALFAIALFLLPQAAKQKSKAEGANGESQGHIANPAPSTTIDINIAASGNENPGERKQQETKPEPRPFITGGEAIIAVITLAYAAVSFFTFLAIHAQMKIAQRQLTLQETALRQWVNVRHWEVWLDKQRGILRIRFHIVNPTALPLTLRLVVLTTQILEIGSQPYAEKFPSEDVLAPNNPFILDISYSLSDDETAKLTSKDDRAGISVHVHCRIQFTDSSTRHWEQIADRGIVFDKGELFALKEYATLTPLVRQNENRLTQQKT